MLHLILIYAGMVTISAGIGMLLIGLFMAILKGKP